MKIKGHQSFHIRRGWIYKGLKEVKQDDFVFSRKDIVHTDVLGIGSNMVTALKYWLEALKLVDKKKEGSKTLIVPSKIGELILEKDPYLEEIETWQLLHYNLATNEEQATTWYWFFNEYKGNKFTKDNLFENLNSYIKQNYEKEVADRSLKDDINCLLNTYVERVVESPEDNMESPFAELGLINIANKKNGELSYTKSYKNKVNVYLAYYIIRNLAIDRENLDLKDIINSKNGIGNIFNLNSYEIMDILDSLQNLGYIKVTRTGGLDYVSFVDERNPIDELENMYE